MVRRIAYYDSLNRLDSASLYDVPYRDQGLQLDNVLNNPLSYTDPSGLAGVPGCPTCDDEVRVPGNRPPSPGLSLGWPGDGSSSGPYSSASFGFGYASPAEGKRGTPSASNDTCSDQQQPGGEEIEEITVIGHPPSKYKYSFAFRFFGMAVVQEAEGSQSIQKIAKCNLGLTIADKDRNAVRRAKSAWAALNN